MNKKGSSWELTNIIAIIILAAILIIGGSLLGSHVVKKQANASVAGLENQFQPTVLKTIDYNGEDGKNALELLQATHEIKIQDSTLGTFVISIDGTANTDTAYWMFYVNDSLATVGANDYVTKSTDKIEWRYESL
jgi:hypothetical protein